MVWAVSLLTTDLITRRLPAADDTVTFGVWLCSVPWDAAIAYSVLYLHGSLAATLALKLFRGEPAISGFDWNFTPSHKSSANVSTGVGSVLHRVSPRLQPAHG